MPENGLMAIYAHPDDETFGVGATMARYAAKGIPVTMVCATRGEVGEIAPGTGATPENLMLYRAQELIDAMAILGVHDVRFLGFRDSGMQGTEENEDQRALMRAHPDAVTHMLVRLIRELKPAVIATWDQSGGYGHPDHIATHHHATAAFHAAGDASKFPTAGAPWQPNALFYTAFPMEEFVRFGEKLRELGIELGFSSDDNEQIAQLKPAVPNCVIDVSDLYDKKIEALLSHKTQMSPDDPFSRAPDELRRDFFSREYFYRAHPPLAEGTTLDDFFSGI